MGKIAKKVPIEGGIQIEFENGEELALRLDELDDVIIRKLAVHGLSQKVGDSYAGAESIAEAVGLAHGVWTNLKAGLWGAKVSRGGKIVEAIHRVTGKTVEECLELWQGMDDAKQKALRKHADVKHELAVMEMERAAALAEAAGDSDDDLNDLFS